MFKPKLGPVVSLCCATVAAGVLCSALTAHAALETGVVGNGTPASCTESALTTALSGGGSISFNCGAAPVTITVSTVQGLVANTALDGGNLVTLRGAGTNRLFLVTGGVVFKLNGIALVNGFDSDRGGAIYATGAQVELSNMRITNSQAKQLGGAIYCYVGSGGAITITNSFFGDNTATNGGALYNDGCRMTVVSSRFIGNTAPLTVTSSSGGGLVHSSYGALGIIRDSVFDSNVGYDGGAVLNYGGATLLISRTRIVSNTAGYGGGLENQGALTVTDSVFSQNSAQTAGGGIWILNGTFDIRRSSISFNSATDGGGFNNYATGGLNQLRDVTINGNTASGFGGGVYNSGEVYLTNVTLNENVAGAAGKGGGGLYNADGKVSAVFMTVADNAAGFGAGIYSMSSSATSELNIYKSLLASNTPDDCGGVINSVGYNVSGDSTCGAFTQPGDIKSANVSLGKLADNGGPVRTRNPLTGNAAIDRVPIGNCNMQDSSSPADARGVARPVGAQCDSGAVERNSGGPVYLPVVANLLDGTVYFEGPNELEPNQTYLEANGPIRADVNYTGLFNDAKDYWRHDVKIAGPVVISLTTSVASGVQLQVFDRPPGPGVVPVTAAVVPPYRVAFNAGTPGTFYIYIYSDPSIVPTSAQYVLRVARQ